MGNRVVHFEVIGTDLDGLEKFYGELFGWHMQRMGDMPYTTIDTHAGEGINGGLGLDPEGGSFQTFYVLVPDLEEALKKIESLGGKRLMDPMEIPNVVAFAQFQDPQGNRVGIVRDDGSPQDGAVSEGDGVGVTWFDVVGTDGAALRDFYSKAFGWEFEMGQAGMDYGMLKPGSEGIPGGVGTAPNGQPAVAVYAEVDDVQKYVDRAKSLGATVMMDATEVAPGTTIGMFLDPQGHQFGVYKHVHPH